ncbi:MAG: P-loop NTPase fold protein [Cellvibrionaceae bacterium]
MSENDSSIERVILIDEPSKEDLFHGKGHEKTASSLAKAIRDFKDKDRSIGLDGPWGSGKSSIVEMAEKELNQSKVKGSINYCFFTFDIWKSQGSAFRRSFLEHLLSWSINRFPSKERKLKEIEKNVKGKTRIIDTNNRTVLDIYGVVLLLLVPFLPLYYFWAKSVFDIPNRETHFLLTAPCIVLYIFLFLTFIRAFISWIKEKPYTSFLEAISKTLLISAKKYEDHTVKQQIREIDPNDFEFEFTLRNILEVVQSDSYKIVFVLDNIDRLPSDEIDEYWALVRSVFSRNSYRNENNGRTLTAIVPYDRHHILNTTEVIKEENNENISSLSNQEIFSKTFDEVLSV